MQLRLVGFSNSAGTAATRTPLEGNPYSRIRLAGWWRAAAPPGQKVPQTLEYSLHGQNVTPPMYKSHVQQGQPRAFGGGTVRGLIA
jgi:hypothetical protein